VDTLQESNIYPILAMMETLRKLCGHSIPGLMDALQELSSHPILMGWTTEKNRAATQFPLLGIAKDNQVVTQFSTLMTLGSIKWLPDSS